MTICRTAAVAVLLMLVTSVRGVEDDDEALEGPMWCKAVGFDEKLPVSGLEPHISQLTIETHYGKHQRGYVNALNEWLESVGGVECGNDSIPLHLIKVTHRNTKENRLASQIFNHALYFATLAPPAHNMQFDKHTVFGMALMHQFENFDNFKIAFGQHVKQHFGSGWVWLLWNTATKHFIITETHDAEVPHITYGDDLVVPLLVCDVWEHAYYLDKKNRRDLYFEDWLQVVNWRIVEYRFGQNMVECAPDNHYPTFDCFHLQYDKDGDDPDDEF